MTTPLINQLASHNVTRFATDLQKSVVSRGRACAFRTVIIGHSAAGKSAILEQLSFDRTACDMDRFVSVGHRSISVNSFLEMLTLGRELPLFVLSEQASTSSRGFSPVAKPANFRIFISFISNALCRSCMRCFQNRIRMEFGTKLLPRKASTSFTRVSTLNTRSLRTVSWNTAAPRSTNLSLCSTRLLQVAMLPFPPNRNGSLGSGQLTAQRGVFPNILMYYGKAHRSASPVKTRCAQ